MRTYKYSLLKALSLLQLPEAVPSTSSEEGKKPSELVLDQSKARDSRQAKVNCHLGTLSVSTACSESAVEYRNSKVVWLVDTWL